MLTVKGLQVHYQLRGGALSRVLGRTPPAVKAVDGIDLTLRRGEVLGLVGESGSGKTTLGRALLGLVPATGGSIRYQDQELVGLSEGRLRPLRRKLQMVFQDPHASLNPSMDIGTAVGDPLRVHDIGSSDEDRRRLVKQALETVGLAPAERYMSMYPSDLSGGQKQRAVIARAIVLEPDLLVADEPVSMLDMSVRAKILQLMIDLGERLDLTYVYITHDLATAKLFCDRVAIMYLGRIVEIGTSEEIFNNPRHPYTKALLRAIPTPGLIRDVPHDLPRGEVPDAVRPPVGCSFHPRCPAAFAPCGWEARDLRSTLEDRWARLDASAYKEESALFADLKDLDAPGRSVRIRPAAGRAGELLALLERMRSDAPDERLWRGITAVREDAGAVVVDFREQVDPVPLAVGTARVECHLFDPRFAPLSEEASR
ncbi:ABC transporter ATP-binding protein [Motilibacter sp. E257]|uniref:ABC transporter ATP-binding protein n=2 Tax=Motilibacter deserti TaxID=2714956 RepID=A0ABX0GYE5_9ACTN|nr:ABC transporter ATP-binding protein [Motilibacter deserti]